MTCIYNKEYILLLVKKQREFFISWDWHFFRSPMKSHLLFVQSPTVWKVKFRKFAKFVNFRKITVATVESTVYRVVPIFKSVSFCFTCQFWGLWQILQIFQNFRLLTLLRWRRRRRTLLTDNKMFWSSRLWRIPAL